MFTKYDPEGFLDEEEFFAEPGDTWSIKGDIEHWVEILEDSVVIIKGKPSALPGDSQSLTFTGI